MKNRLSPIEVIEKIAKLLKEHPNVRIIADIPALDGYSLDRGLFSISNVYYESEIGIVKEEPIDFKEYIIIACD